MSQATQTARRLFHGGGQISLVTRVLESLNRLVGPSFAKRNLNNDWKDSGRYIRDGSGGYHLFTKSLCASAKPMLHPDVHIMVGWPDVEVAASLVEHFENFSGYN